MANYILSVHCALTKCLIHHQIKEFFDSELAHLSEMIFNFSNRIVSGLLPSYKTEYRELFCLYSKFNVRHCVLCILYIIYIYRWTAVSAGNTFQDLPRLRKTADNTECYIYNVPLRDIRVTCINTVKFNWYITHSKTLSTLNELIITCTVHYIVRLLCTSRVTPWHQFLVPTCTRHFCLSVYKVVMYGW